MLARVVFGPKYFPHLATEEKKWLDLERSAEVFVLGIFHDKCKRLRVRIGPPSTFIGTDKMWKSLEFEMFWLKIFEKLVPNENCAQAHNQKRKVQLRSALVYCACAQRDRKVKPVSEIIDLLKKQHANEVPRNALIGMEENSLASCYMYARRDRCLMMRNSFTEYR